MFLNKLFQTSSFRLTLISAAVFCIALLLLANFVVATTDSMMVHQSDLEVEGEVEEIFNDAKQDDIGHLKQTIDRMSATSPQYFYALESKTGEHLAGNLSHPEPIIGTHDWRANGSNGSGTLIHGVGMRTVDGAYLFVGVVAYRTGKVYARLTRYFLWITVIAIVALSISGLFISNRLFSRVEAISRTTREIISGNLQRRVPVTETDDEFDHLAVSLNTMLDRIQSLMTGLNQVSNDIAHDLRTPLTRLRQRLEHARSKATTEAELRHAVDQSIEQVDVILAIFSSLLRIAQIEAGIRNSGFRKLDLSGVLREVIELYRPVITDKLQHLTVDVADDLVILGDAELLTQLLANLFDNATSHTPPGSAISLTGFAEADKIIVEIRDNGPGIPEENTEKVLRRFFRLEQSRSTPGNGLGLSLVAAVTEQHGAKIELLDNRPGLLIRLSFPILVPELMALQQR